MDNVTSKKMIVTTPTPARNSVPSVQYDINPINFETDDEFDVNIDDDLYLDMNFDDDFESLYAAGAAPKTVTKVTSSVKKLKDKLPQKQVETLQKNVDKLKLNKSQMDNYVKNYAAEYKLTKKLDKSKSGDTVIKVGGKKQSITSDVVAKLKNDNRNIDARAIAANAGKYFKGKSGDYTKTQYNNLLKSFVNLNYYNQTAKREVPNVAKKTQDDYRFDINKNLKSKNIKLSDPVSSQIRSEINKNLRNLNLSKLPSNVYGQILNKTTDAYVTALTKVDNRIDKAVKTLNKENSSGSLPPTSNYRDLKSNGLIYFDDKNKAWKETQKAKQLGGVLTVGNNMLTSNQMYNDISNYIGVKYPGLSKDKKFINNVVNSAIGLGNQLYGDLSSNNYQQFINNFVDAKAIMKPYSANSIKPEQLTKDLKQTLSNYYDTTKINSKVVDKLASYVKKFDLSKLTSQDYDNLLNGVAKGYGMGSNTLSATGQGLNGRLTIDNKNVPPAKLQYDVIETLKNVYKNNPISSKDMVANAKEIALYLNTKGGNVDSSNYQDLLNGLAGGYGIGKNKFDYSK